MDEYAIDAILLDMDGVVRHWNSAHAERTERSFGLPPGALLRVGTEVPEYAIGARGGCTFGEWLDATARQLAQLIGPSARDAVTAWSSYRGDIDEEMLGIVARLRTHYPVHVLSNAHDCFLDDMRQLGLLDAFDGFHVSAELGVAKPDRGFFEAALERIGIPADRCLFTDDRPENVAGARSAGLRAFVFTTPAAFCVALAAWTGGPGQ